MDDKEPPTTSVFFSDKQVRVLNSLETFSASLSVIGSIIILLKILSDRKQNGSTTPYERIMVGLSSWDILASITWSIDNILDPFEREKGEVEVWAFGKGAACKTSAFLTQASIAGWWYNCLLSYYFLLTVVSQLKRKNFVQKCELWLHLSALFFPITAIIGLCRGWFYSNKEDCWIRDETIAWIVAGIPVLFTYASLIINNSVMYAILRKQLHSSERQNQLKKEAGTLMLLYVFVFFITVAPNFAKQILESYFGYDMTNSRKMYPLWILDSILRPLQGFFNFFIYIKPMYARFRAANRNKSMAFVLYQSLVNFKAPQMHHPRNAHHITHMSCVEINDVTFAEESTINPNKALFNVSKLMSSRNPSLSTLKLSGYSEESKQEESERDGKKDVDEEK